MARKTSSRSGGSTLYGILAGLVIGLAAAVAVALFVTQVPMPFVDKASRDPAQTLLPDPRDAPDPNISLYGKGSAAGVSPSGPTDTTIAPLPGTQAPGGKTPSGPALSDSIGDLIATLGAPDSARQNQPSPDAKPAPVPAAPGASSPAPKAATNKAAPASTQVTYYLQAGAFRSERDAEAIKARILLLGLPAHVQKAQINGATINRVRVGPFKGIDEMNRSRVRLGEEKIASSVVRQ